MSRFMSGFKETADKARRDAKMAQQQLKDAQDRVATQALEEKQRLEQQCEEKLQTARELLSRTDAQSILSSVRDEVWGVGEIITIPGNFEVNIAKSPQYTIVWPSVSLVAEKTGLSYTTPGGSGGGRGPGASGYIPPRSLKDGYVRSILKIMAAPNEERLGILIYRRNEENFFWTNGISQTGNIDHQKILGFFRPDKVYPIVKTVNGPS